jgi:hypothetical protein
VLALERRHTCGSNSGDPSPRAYLLEQRLAAMPFFPGLRIRARGELALPREGAEESIRPVEQAARHVERIR